MIILWKSHVHSPIFKKKIFEKWIYLLWELVRLLYVVAKVRFLCCWACGSWVVRASWGCEGAPCDLGCPHNRPRAHRANRTGFRFGEKAEISSCWTRHHLRYSDSEKFKRLPIVLTTLRLHDTMAQVFHFCQYIIIIKYRILRDSMIIFMWLLKKLLRLD